MNGVKPVQPETKDAFIAKAKKKWIERLQQTPESPKRETILKAVAIGEGRAALKLAKDKAKAKTDTASGREKRP